MRDELKSNTYFKERLAYLDESINQFEELLIQYKDSTNVNFRSAYLSLLNYYSSKINCSYSIGDPIEIINKLLPRYVNLIEKTWDKETGSYIQLLQAVSLGIFLEETKELEILQQLVQREGFHDFLIDYMFHSVDNSWVKTNELAFTRPYETLKAVTQAHTKEVAETLLKQYVEKEWYQGHRDAGWYNSHKSPHAIYNGYWSYESGAVAKIMQLDDAEFQTINYYPYDFVQYEQ
ncbi:PoNe immunity protein domain-containing protein [Listeria goaensis]|uniref:PoNe immunity protein domain-containing protein n=1 Tax=Listeria goaensis TaxID=1649188 RepID=UPI0013C36D41|nr:PoNe immunity protein domain-containing protein [Listeria goaensis]